jgi:hypothetical protein
MNVGLLVIRRDGGGTALAEVVSSVHRLPPADQAKRLKKETGDPDELWDDQPLTLLHPILPLSVVVWTIRVQCTGGAFDFDKM